MTNTLKKKVKVAVYGSLRKDLYNHGWLKGAEFIGQYETEPEYCLIDCGAFPGLLKNGTTSVVMEVYEVDAEHLRRIDSLEGYHGVGQKNHYNREKIKSPFGEVYTYFYYNQSEMIRAKAIETGDWVDYVRTSKINSILI